MKTALLNFKTILVFVVTCCIFSCVKSDGVYSDPNYGQQSSGTTAGDGTTSATTQIDSTYTSGSGEGSTETGYNADDFVESSFTLSSTVKIVFGAVVTVTNPLKANGVSITTDGNNVVINATVTGVAYDISGGTSNGSLKIYSDKSLN